MKFQTAFPIFLPVLVHSLILGSIRPLLRPNSILFIILPYPFHKCKSLSYLCKLSHSIHNTYPAHSPSHLPSRLRKCLPLYERTPRFSICCFLALYLSSLSLSPLIYCNPSISLHSHSYPTAHPFTP